MHGNELNYSAYKYAEFNLQNLNHICKPVLGLGIKVFAYFRFFNNGKYLSLCNRLDWLKFCLQNIHDNETTALGREISHASVDGYYCYLWPLAQTDYLFQALYEFDIWQGLSIFKKNDLDKSVELWGFALDRNAIAGNRLYIENIEIVRKFTTHFNLSAQDIITPSHDNMATYRDFKAPVYHDIHDLHKIIEFIRKTPVSKHPLLVNGNEVQLTTREYECINFLAMGKSAKDIAIGYNTSYRTVEKIIENIKKKTGINDKEVLIKVYNQSVLSWL